MDTADVTIARLAGPHWQLVTRVALLKAGVTRSAIAHRLSRGRLVQVHPGVYFTGTGDLTIEQRWLAAVLACGPGAALSHGSAAALWRMLPMPPGPVEVVRSGANREGPAGVLLRMTSQPEITEHRGIPVTTPLRTLLDLAATDHPGLELAVQEAQVLRLVTAKQLSTLAASGRHGAARLRAPLTDRPGFTRSDAERRLRTLLLKAQLPPAHHNVRVEGHEVDAFWLEHRLILEVDGYAAHGHRAAFERDRERDQHFAAAGYRVVRVTWRQLTTAPEAIAARLGAALRAPAPAPTPPPPPASGPRRRPSRPSRPPPAPARSGR